MSFKDGHENDFVSGLTGSRLGANIYLRDRVHARMDFPKTITAVRDFTKKWPEAKLKLVEDKANGPAVISDAAQQDRRVLSRSHPRATRSRARTR
jgi:phage terminase large subunit-like protein